MSNYFIIGRDFVSPLVAQVQNLTSLNMNIQKEQKLNLLSDPMAKICTTHEESIEAIKSYLPENENKKAIQLFRDKWDLRTGLAPIFNDFYFSKVLLSDIPNVQLSFNCPAKKYLIKPVKGFFSIGVHVIHKDTNLHDLQLILKNTMKHERVEHPYYIQGGCLSDKEYIIEEMIGDNSGNLHNLSDAEIAIDGYYNIHGEFALLGIYHHPFPKHKKFFHLLYYTNASLFERYYDKIFSFCSELPKYLGIQPKCFPIHAEFKCMNNTLFPIEVNPLRFGGMGLADTLYHAIRINPYRCFYENLSFDWKKEWKGVTENFAWVLGYRSSNPAIKFNALQTKQLKERLSSGLLQYTAIDDDEIFGFAYIKKTKIKDFEPILEIDYDQFDFIQA